MDKSDHFDHLCNECRAELKIRARTKRGEVLKDPIYCPFCGHSIKKKREIIVTGPPLTGDELAKEALKVLKEEYRVRKL